MNKEQLLIKYRMEFDHVAPDEEQINRITKVRESYKQLLSNIIENCPLSDDLTEALKFLDISRMIAVKSIVMDEKIKKEYKNVYFCERCFKDTNVIEHIPGTTFAGVCNECKKIIEELNNKGVGK